MPTKMKRGIFNQAVELQMQSDMIHSDKRSYFVIQFAIGSLYAQLTIYSLQHLVMLWKKGNQLG